MAGAAPPDFTVAAAPTDADRAAILAALVTANDAAAGRPSGYRPVALLCKDADGAVTGGLWARITYDWMFLELLVVPAALRGQGLGRRLLAAAEQQARAAGCRGVWLDTFSFQAPAFYRKLGYSEFGVIEGHPVGGRRHFFMKTLD
jgi:GNAT superfamily N-acetyltransferase